MSKTPKPIIHSRDHEHGGADTVRIHYESVGTGGGGPGFVNQAEAFSPSSYTTVAATGLDVYLPWVSAGPDTLLDTTTPTTPVGATVLTDGLYTLYANWHGSGGLSAAGKVMVFQLQIYPYVGGPLVWAYFVQQAAGAGSTVTPTGVGSITLFLPAGTILWSSAANHDTTSLGVKNFSAVYRIM